MGKYAGCAIYRVNAINTLPWLLFWSAETNGTKVGSAEGGGMEVLLIIYKDCGSYGQ